MNALKRSVLLALGVATAGCEFVRSPTEVDLEEKSVVVHAVLAAGSDRAAVLLTQVGPEEEPVPGRQYPFGSGIEPISGAEVQLIAGSETVRLEEAPSGFRSCYGSPYGSDTAQVAGKGCYAARVPGGVRSGVKYSLRVRLPDGRTIQGEASPPSNPELLEPQRQARVEVRAGYSNYDYPGVVRVRFRAPAGVAGIGLAIQPLAMFKDGIRMTDVQCSLAAPSRVAPTGHGDTISLPIYGLGCGQGEGSNRRSVRPDSVHARLHVTGYDAPFVRYQAAVQEEQARAGALTQGVSGALGLFAGEATVERTITLVPTE